MLELVTQTLIIDDPAPYFLFCQATTAFPMKEGELQEAHVDLAGMMFGQGVPILS